MDLASHILMDLKNKINQKRSTLLGLAHTAYWQDSHQLAQTVKMVHTQSQLAVRSNGQNVFYSHRFISPLF